ncbi:unnamed protein product, partial [marine sediment metagenome]
SVSAWRVNIAQFDEKEEMYQISFHDKWMFHYATEIKKRVQTGLNKFRESYDPEQILFLQYETFFNDFECLFSQLEKFFMLKIGQETRNQIEKELSIASIKRKSKEYKDFTEYDKMTRFHGHHIFTGEPGSWRKLIIEEDHNSITEFFYCELEAWGYIEG